MDGSRNAEERRSATQSSVHGTRSPAGDGEGTAAGTAAAAAQPQEEAPAEVRTGAEPREKERSGSVPTADAANEPSKEPQAAEERTEGLSNKRKAALPRRPLKRARTAFFIYSEHLRAQVQARHPGESIAATAKRLGSSWKALSDQEKEKYQLLAAEERRQAGEELEAWKAAGGSVDDLHLPTPSSAGTDLSASTVFPIAKVRKICKLDPEVRTMSKEALLLVAKCTEFFTARLGKESVKVSQMHNRRKILPEDVAHVCSTREPYMFLKDDVKDLVQDQLQQKKTDRSAANQNGANGSTAASNSATASASEKATVAANAQAAAGSKPLTTYFATHKQPDKS